LMAAGATIYYPSTCVIDGAVEIGPDTIIEPFVQLLGTTRIGSDCRIRSYSVITDSEIGDGVTVRHGTVMDQARIANHAIIGPYSHLRPGSDIGEGAHVGNFVETKKIKLGKGSKANHLTYLGDAEIGAGVNVGAGTITCNYDGVNKHKTTIEDGVFVGSDATLVAPVTIGKNAYVAAASCGQNRTGLHPSAVGIFPAIPKSSECEQRSIIDFETKRLLGHPPSLPLVESVCGNQAPARLQCITKSGFREGRLRPCIDHACGHRCMGNELGRTEQEGDCRVNCGRSTVVYAALLQRRKTTSAAVR
ncbi:MAG: hypothetical protein DMG71_20415, partial [Acidobacteria bacterium]